MVICKSRTCYLSKIRKIRKVRHLIFLGLARNVKCHRLDFAEIIQPRKLNLAVYKPLARSPLHRTAHISSVDVTCVCSLQSYSGHHPCCRYSAASGTIMSYQQYSGSVQNGSHSSTHSGHHTSASMSHGYSMHAQAPSQPVAGASYYPQQPGYSQSGQVHADASLSCTSIGPHRDDLRSRPYALSVFVKTTAIFERIPGAIKRRPLRSVTHYARSAAFVRFSRPSRCVPRLFTNVAFFNVLSPRRPSAFAGSHVPNPPELPSRFCCSTFIRGHTTIPLQFAPVIDGAVRVSALQKDLLTQF
jgi:hypothetical protein